MAITCKKCLQVLSVDLFEKTTNGFRRTCKDCRKLYFKKVNSGRMEYIASANRECVKKNRIRTWEYFKNNPCIDCGEEDPMVLEFDHVSGSKEAAISQLVNSKRKWEEIQQEIEKCVVRCANCHRRKTAKTLGWYSYMERASEEGKEGCGGSIPSAPADGPIV